MYVLYCNILCQWWHQKMGRVYITICKTHEVKISTLLLISAHRSHDSCYFNTTVELKFQFKFCSQWSHHKPIIVVFLLFANLWIFHKYIQNVQMPFVKNIFIIFTIAYYLHTAWYCIIIIFVFKMNSQYTINLNFHLEK